MTAPASETASFGPAARAAARLAAVQALYQMEMTGIGVEAVIAEFLINRIGHAIDGDEYIGADANLFADLLRGVVAGQDEVDGLIIPALSGEWPLHRIDSTLRAIMRAAVFELTHRHDIPAKVILSEYLDIAHAFFSGSEPGFANAVLDTIARKARPGAFAADVRQH